jgi:thioredoxin reductase (NADPH)
MQFFDVIVIGQGCAGLTAARLAVQNELSVATFEAESIGGLVINIMQLDPSPEGRARTGEDLVGKLTSEDAGHRLVNVFEAVTGVERNSDGMWSVKTDSKTWLAHHVVVASGARLRKLGVPGEKTLQGVSECADCDALMIQGKEAVVVGGGDSAFQEALALSQHASKVTIVMRGKGPRARTDFVKRVAADPKLVQLTNARVIEILGNGSNGVEGVRIDTGSGERTLPCKGVFIYVGLEPNTGFVPAGLRRDENGALVTTNRGATSLPGLWAIGAARSGHGGLLSDAAADARRVIDALS